MAINMTYKTWMDETKRGLFTPRSKQLVAIDKAFAAYEKQKTPLTENALRQALDAWITWKGANWRSSTRNTAGTVEQLDSELNPIPFDPDLAPDIRTGIRKNIYMRRIVDEMKKVENEWGSLTPFQRVNRIAAVVTRALTQNNVPAPTLQILDLGGGLNGQFDFGPWALQINTTLAATVHGETANALKRRVAQLGDTITHEARHCEQWWRMARVKATAKLKQGLTPDARVMSQDLGMPLIVMQQAIQSGQMDEREYAQARAWYESVYGKGATYRNINLNGRGLRPTGGRFGGIGEQFQRTEFARYERGLAEENDAHQTGQEIQVLFLTGSGVQPAPLIGHNPAARFGRY